jgi:anti-sigma regulatory factor (Ser/Thr protein kinase)/PAS domain-containing protein
MAWLAVLAHDYLDVRPCGGRSGFAVATRRADGSGSPGHARFSTDRGRIRVAGELDFSNVEELTAKLARVDPVGGRLLVDVTDVAFVGVCAARELVRAARAIDEPPRVMVRNPPQVLVRVLDVLGWADEIDVSYGETFNVMYDSAEMAGGSSPSGGPGVRIDAASARDLNLFMSRLPRDVAGTVSRPVVAWRGTDRSIIQVHLSRVDGGEWQLRLGEERPEQAAPDMPEVLDPRLDDLSTMVWVTDGDRLAKWFNTAWLEFVGAELVDELGWGWMRHIHRHDLFALLQAYEAAQHHRTDFEHVARLTDRHGQLWWVRVRAVPRRTNGDFSGFVGICEPLEHADLLMAQERSGLNDVRVTPDLGVETEDNDNRLANIQAALQSSQPAEPIEAGLLRQLASGWVRQHDELRTRHDDIVLAIGEAAANSIVHAYPDGRGQVRLACEIRRSHAQFRVRDWGTSGLPRPDPDSRGTALMHTLTDNVRIDHLSDGTEVVLSYNT